MLLVTDFKQLFELEDENLKNFYAFLDGLTLLGYSAKRLKSDPDSKTHKEREMSCFFLLSIVQKMKNSKTAPLLIIMLSLVMFQWNLKKSIWNLLAKLGILMSQTYVRNLLLKDNLDQSPMYVFRKGIVTLDNCDMWKKVS